VLKKVPRKGTVEQTFEADGKREGGKQAAVKFRESTQSRGRGSAVRPKGERSHSSKIVEVE